jgi:hypothetical protein
MRLLGSHARLGSRPRSPRVPYPRIPRALILVPLPNVPGASARLWHGEPSHQITGFRGHRCEPGGRQAIDERVDDLRAQVVAERPKEEAERLPITSRSRTGAGGGLRSSRARARTAPTARTACRAERVDRRRERIGRVRRHVAPIGVPPTRLAVCPVRGELD